METVMATAGDSTDRRHLVLERPAYTRAASVE